jgi:hypothetical protein
MKKTVPSIGVIIFGILFVGIGLYQLYSGFTVITAKKAIAPVVYNAGVQRVHDLEKFIDQRTQGYEQNKKQVIYADVNQMKSALQNYRVHYVEKNDFSWATKIFMVVCLAAAGLSLYAGIALLKLRTHALLCVALSLAAGLVLSFVFLWDTFNDIAFILRLSEKIMTIFSHIQGSALPATMSNVALAKSVLTPLTSMTLSFFFSCYALFTSITALYLRRPKVKAQFEE